jgi:hypothetical protein
MEEVIDDEDYLEIKTDCKDKLKSSEAKLTKGKDNKKIDFQKLLDQALSNLVDLAKVYTDGDIEVKRKIIGSIFPEKLQFSKKSLSNHPTQCFALLYIPDKQ